MRRGGERVRRWFVAGGCLAVAALVVGCSTTTNVSTPGPAGSNQPAGSSAAPTTSTGPSGAGTTIAPVATRSPGCDNNVDGAVTVSTHVDQALTSSGVGRTYKWYVPAGPSSSPRPLVVDLHGYAEGHVIHTAMSNFAATAEKENILLATPSGTGTVAYWNAVPSATGPADLQFLSDLIDDMGRLFCVDPTRVFMTGLSNGAFMSSLIACRLSAKVAAIAPVAGLRYPKDCAPGRAVPIVAFHGTDDQFVSYDGSWGAKAQELEFDEQTAKDFEGLDFAPIPATLEKWATAQGCATPAVESEVSASVKLVKYSDCRDGSVVELYVVQGGGHSWPGSAFSETIVNAVGPTTMEIDANELMWEFFEAHPLPSARTG
jgi:polyhydroxybutyrate depolymerase